MWVATGELEMDTRATPCLGMGRRVPQAPGEDDMSTHFPFLNSAKHLKAGLTSLVKFSPI